MKKIIIGALLICVFFQTNLAAKVTSGQIFKAIKDYNCAHVDDKKYHYDRLEGLMETWTLERNTYPINKKTGDNHLHKVCFLGLLNLVKLFLRDEFKQYNLQSPLFRQNKFGKTPLDAAAEKDHYYLFEYFYDQGINIVQTNKFNDTPFHTAAYHNSGKVLEFYLSKNEFASLVKQEGANGKKPLEKLILNTRIKEDDKLENVQVFLDHRSPLNWASIYAKATQQNRILSRCDKQWLANLEAETTTESWSPLFGTKTLPIVQPYNTTNMFGKLPLA